MRTASGELREGVGGPFGRPNPLYHRHPPRATAWHPLNGTDLQRGVGRGGDDANRCRGGGGGGGWDRP